MSIRWDKQRRRFIVDYYPQGRAGKRVHLILLKSLTDPGIRGKAQRQRCSAIHVMPHFYPPYVYLRCTPATKYLYENDILRIMG
jgi:hypothetical protein